MVVTKANGGSQQHLGVAMGVTNVMTHSCCEHGSSSILILTHSESHPASQSRRKVFGVSPVDESQPSSHCSSSSLRTDEEGVSQTTFYTAQQSIVNVAAAETMSSHAQAACKVSEGEKFDVTQQNAAQQNPVLATPAALDSVVTERKVRDEISLLIGLKDRLESIFGCSGNNDLEPQQSIPDSIDQEFDVTNAAVASIPFADTAQTGVDLPKDVTSDEIPCIVYLPTSSTFGESSSHEHKSFVADAIVTDETSSLGSHDSYLYESDPLPKTSAVDETSTAEANMMRNGPVYATMISSALEQHAASLERIRRESNVGEDSTLFIAEEPNEVELDNPFDEVQEVVVDDEEHARGSMEKARVESDAKGAVASVLQDAYLNTPVDVEENETETLSRNEKFDDRPCHQNPVTEGEPASLKQSVPEACSNLLATDVPGEDEIETFQTAAQSTWEQHVFGLSVSEVKADFMLVLEEVTGASQVNTSSESYEESNSKMCGGCGWLARLMCW
jgi:hypothetical protein